MTRDIERLLDMTTPTRVSELNVADLVRRGARRRAARRTGSVIAACALVAGGVQLASGTDLFGDDGGQDVAGTELGSAGVGPLIDGLIERNEELPDAPPREGHALVSQGVGVDESNGALRIFEWKSMLSAKGDGSRHEVTIAEDVPFGTTLEELRALVDEHLGDVVSTEVVTPTAFPDARKLLASAEDAAAEGRDDRALALLLEALPVAFDPQHRITALRVLDDVDVELLLREDVTTLIGSAGTGISWFDGLIRPDLHTLVFDPQTGEYIGSMTESHLPDDPEEFVVTSVSTESGSDVVVDGPRGG